MLNTIKVAVIDVFGNAVIFDLIDFFVFSLKVDKRTVSSVHFIK